jgi:hypothetical protein
VFGAWDDPVPGRVPARIYVFFFGGISLPVLCPEADQLAGKTDGKKDALFKGVAKTLDFRL